MTAGNSSQTSDGAAVLLMMTEEMVNKHNLTPIARLVSYATAGVPPKIMGIGPVAAIPKALDQASLKLKDIDQIELNEAFAAQSIAVIRELDINPETCQCQWGSNCSWTPAGLHRNQTLSAAYLTK